MDKQNIFAHISGEIDAEVIELLNETANVRIERIISNGNVPDEPDWFDQESDEWILLLEGSAGMLFEGENQETKLTKGDFLFIPAHKRHKVLWTSSSEQTLWLAIHISK